VQDRLSSFCKVLVFSAGGEISSEACNGPESSTELLHRFWIQALKWGFKVAALAGNFGQLSLSVFFSPAVFLFLQTFQTNSEI